MSTSTLAPVVESPSFPELTIMDRCDRCEKTDVNPHGVQAFVRAVLASGLSLLFCKHHGDKLTPALVAKGAQIIDETDKINHKASESSA